MEPTTGPVDKIGAKQFGPHAKWTRITDVPETDEYHSFYLVEPSKKMDYTRIVYHHVPVHPHHPDVARYWYQHALTMFPTRPSEELMYLLYYLKLAPKPEQETLADFKAAHCGSTTHQSRLQRARAQKR